MSIKQKIIKKNDRELNKYEKTCHSDFKRGIHTFNLILRQDVRRVPTYNQLVKNISKEELIEQIRTNFVVYTDYCPTYPTILNTVEDHLKKCLCAVHWFLETEPICMNAGKEKKDISNILGDLCDVYRFMKYLCVKDKKDFLKNHIFNLLMLDVDSAHFILHSPHFESNLEGMQDMVVGQKIPFLKNVSFNKFKSMLENHITTCKGPCVLLWIPHLR